MPTARPGRRIAAIAASAVAHFVVLAVVASQSPMLKIPPEPGGPPIPIIPVLLEPRTPPAGPAARPQPIRLHRRPQRFSVLPIPPLPVPVTEAGKPAGPGPAAFHPAPLPESPKGDVKAALRQGPVGCANPDAVGLTKAERQVCDEVLGKGAKTALFPGLGLNRDKQADFDRDAARKESDRRYREQQIAPGPAPPAATPFTLPIPSPRRQ